MEYKTRAEVPNEFKWDLSKMYRDLNDVEKDIEEKLGKTIISNQNTLEYQYEKNRIKIEN